LTTKVKNLTTNIDKNDDSKNVKKLLKELKIVSKESSQMKDVIQEFKDEVDYWKQRENKLMYFLYVMKEKGLPVGEIFESEIKDIPTKRFSKYFDEDSMVEKMKDRVKHTMSLSERIFPSGEDQIVSDTTSIMNITYAPAALQKKFSIVPVLRLDNLPPRHLHYFSDASEQSGFDLSVERVKAGQKATLAQKYDLSSYGQRMKQKKIKESHSMRTIDKNILELGIKIFDESESNIFYEA
jgi:hypothetical protein